jgi:hypothetical protein
MNHDGVMVPEPESDSEPEGSSCLFKLRKLTSPSRAAPSELESYQPGSTPAVTSASQTASFSTRTSSRVLPEWLLPDPSVGRYVFKLPASPFIEEEPAPGTGSLSASEPEGSGRTLVLRVHRLRVVLDLDGVIADCEGVIQLQVEQGKPAS